MGVCSICGIDSLANSHRRCRVEEIERQADQTFLRTLRKRYDGNVDSLVADLRAVSLLAMLNNLRKSGQGQRQLGDAEEVSS